MHGQVIVELAIALPVIFALIGLIVAVGYLGMAEIRIQQTAVVLAEVAATMPDPVAWEAVVADTDTRSGCNGDPEPEVTYPDADRVRVRLFCHLRTPWPGFINIPATFEAEAVR